MPKPRKTCLKCKYQLKQITTSKKNVATDRRYILKKMDLKFQNPNGNHLFSTYAKFSKKLTFLIP